MAAMNQEMSRLSLGVFAGALLNAPTTSLFQSKQTLVGKYPLAPALIYILFLLIYAVLSFAVFIWAFLLRSPLVQAPDGSTVTSLELTQQHLTDPLSLVAAAFPESTKTQPTVPKIAQEQFDEDNTTPRLRVGIDADPTTQNNFRVYKRQNTWSGQA